MNYIKNIVIWLLLSILLLGSIRKYDYYSELAEVVEVSCDSITFRTTDGYVYDYDKDFHWRVGDEAILTLENVKSEGCADDVIIKVKHSGRK